MDDLGIISVLKVSFWYVQDLFNRHVEAIVSGTIKGISKKLF